MTGIPIRHTDAITVSQRQGDWPARLALMAAGLFCLLLLGLAWAVLNGKVGGVGDLGKSVDGLSADMSEMGVKQDTMGRDVTDLTKRVDSMATNVDRLKTDMASVKERTEGVARVEDKLNSMERQLASVSEALTRLAADRQHYNTANETMATHIAAAREAATAAAEQSRAVAARVDNIDREVKDMQRVMADYQAGRIAVAPAAPSAPAVLSVAALPAPSHVHTPASMTEVQPGAYVSTNPPVVNSLPSTQPNSSTTIVIMEQPAPYTPAPAPAPAPAPMSETVVVYTRETGRFPTPSPNRMTTDSEPHSDNIPTEYSPYDYRYTGVGPVRMTVDSEPNDPRDTPPQYTKMAEPYFPDGHGAWGAVAHREAHYARDLELRPNHGERMREGGHYAPDRLNRRVKVSSVGRNYAQRHFGIIGMPFDAVGNGVVWIGEQVDSAVTGTKFVRPEGK